MSFSFLERSVKILIVDDEPGLVAVYLEHLNAYPLYEAHSVGSARQAERFLSSKNCHVCLLDLGMNDIDNDEYYLIKKYSPKTSFMVVSARDSLEKGFQAKSCGAFAAVKKPVDFFQLEFFHCINNAFLQSIVTPKGGNGYKPVIRTAADILVSSRPDSVQQWAEKVGVDERYLRRVWLECFGCLPKHIQWFARTFYFATLNYDNYYRRKFGIKTGVDDTRVEPGAGLVDQFRQFYAAHTREICGILDGVRAT
jgi:CheY-like chemotaxis protein